MQIGTSILRQPKSFLLQIIINGHLSAVVRSYYEGVEITGPLHVQVGDRVAWLVQLGLAYKRVPPPFEIAFSNRAFFGTASVSVPQGGMTAFFPVLLINGHVSYSLTLPGIGCIFDPDIQSGGDGGFKQHDLGKIPAPNIYPTLTTTVSFEVVWNRTANRLTFTKDGTAATWPMQPAAGDSVHFNTGQDSSLLFSPNRNAWATPFQADEYLIPGGKTLVVNDRAEGGDPTNHPVRFPFTATAPATPGSPVYDIDL